MPSIYLLPSRDLAAGGVRLWHGHDISLVSDGGLFVVDSELPEDAADMIKGFLGGERREDRPWGGGMLKSGVFISGAYTCMQPHSRAS